jgi:methylated-DNA-protein-cysteine methyltransferase-like protein
LAKSNIEGHFIPISEFAADVIKQIRMIPKSKVATYKQIAALAGKPHASRAVSWILNSCSKSHNLPWHRVINAKGQIAFDKESKHYKLQKKLLNSEKISVMDQGGVDLEKFQWKEFATPKEELLNSPKMFR